MYWCYRVILTLVRAEDRVDGCDKLMLRVYLNTFDHQPPPCRKILLKSNRCYWSCELMPMGTIAACQNEGIQITRRPKRVVKKAWQRSEISEKLPLILVLHGPVSILRFVSRLARLLHISLLLLLGLLLPRLQIRSPALVQAHIIRGSHISP